MNSSEQQTKQAIQETLADFGQGRLAENALALFDALGYRSDKRIELAPNTAAAFCEAFDAAGRLNPANALLAEWCSVDMLFQLTGDEVTNLGQARFPFDAEARVDNTIIQSYLFFAIELAGEHYTRSQLAGATREINKLFPMPVMILFRHGPCVTLSIINRRLNKRDEGRDVLEKVTLIKDIATASPHRAHIEILFDLSLDELYAKLGFGNFIELHNAWQKTLDTAELNKRFFREVANWYFWAVQNVQFPKAAGADPETRNATSVIRLITRLIFVWFLKEKGLAPEALFDRKRLDDILHWSDGRESSFYKAILQNLFFATLNQEMNSPGKQDKRVFRKDGQHYNITNLYRYRAYFRDPDRALALFASIPFLNGGLFECLDKPSRDDTVHPVRVDGFSDRPDNELSVPDRLFFGAEQEVDLNAVYDTRNKRYKVRGLIPIFDSYKFTVTENTPIEEEVALDPELLGKVFENLLAAYNPETGVTARKQTGSFYTPREIVDTMVDESLIAYLELHLACGGLPNPPLAEAAGSGDPARAAKPHASAGLPNPLLAETSGSGDPARAEVSPIVRGGLPNSPESPNLQERLRHLFAYTDEPHRFNEAEVGQLIEAIDHVKILDPACGSGAFPMGILHKLVFILAKLDPGNERWKDKQIAKAAEIADPMVRERAIADIEQAFAGNELDYGRKLYLIQNCIYGVDIQPIAVQIAKLRCFISLVAEQRTEDTAPNRGILPLPNLETNFVAANTLLGIQRTQQFALRNTAIDEKEDELARVRQAHFTARTAKTKAKYRERDRELRQEIAALLEQTGLPWATTEKLAHWDPYDQNAAADFFDPEWMLGVRDGFDITIGNPPYVRADSGEAHLALRRAIEASGQYETLWEKWDLYIPFIEKGYKLLKPGGFTTLIVSDAYCHSKYAQKSQTWFLQHSRVRRLDFLSRIQIFDAAVRNITYLFEKADGGDNRPQRRLHDPEFGAVTLLPTAEQRNLTYRAFFPDEGGEQRFSASTIPLEEICYISVGMVVHADEKVAQGAFELSDLVSDREDAAHPKPFIEGKHLARWLPATHRWLEWGTSRAPSLFRRPTFPALYEVEEKLLVLRIGGKEIRACYDNAQLLCNHTSVVCVPWRSLADVRNNSLRKTARYGNEPPRLGLSRREDLEQTSRRFAIKYLLAIMNSSFAHGFLQAIRRSNTDLYPDDWKKLPIPDVPAAQQAPVIALVDRILAARRADPAADVSALEREIDQLVYRLYGLTAEEIAIVEEGGK